MQKIKYWKKYITYFYIYGIVIIPYYSTDLWIPIFYDMHSDNYILSIITTALNAWAVVAYNVFFTSEFIYILIKIYGSKDNFTAGIGNTKIYLICVKSILHFIVSTLANVMYIYFPIFVPDTLTFNIYYNMGICFGLHFLFNYKIDRYILAIADFFFPSELTRLTLDSSAERPLSVKVCFFGA